MKLLNFFVKFSLVLTVKGVLKDLLAQIYDLLFCNKTLEFLNLNGFNFARNLYMINCFKNVQPTPESPFSRFNKLDNSHDEWK